ncbi:AGE family epimerase/isomerase [Microlunatus speluncae]|uniref:AGE family epimerase/isomerase n=1 Tax=Microlunatus speluncae TaxID=2594267 RepID=UPI0012663923|nr:AGE family epimerase/isomerase [Microlunatus speluncae]
MNGSAVDAFDGWREARRLIDFGRAALADVGFGRLDRAGRLGPEPGSDLVITARMTYCFSVGALLDWPDCAGPAAHGVAALAGPFHDHEYGGFFRTVPPTGPGERKEAYQHGFVVLAAATAAAAGIPGAGPLLDQALMIMERRFWSERDRALIEGWDRPFCTAEPYWGANANMHGVEAMIAASVQTGDPLWRDRALAVADTFVNRQARAAGWLLPEHYGPDWRVDRDYHADRPADEFRPYGVTVGHLLEWSRLLLELGSSFPDPPGWLAEASRQLYDTAFDRGWQVDGAPGFVYTIDWDGEPVVHTRPHWVVAEAIAATATWRAVAPEPIFDERLTLVIDYTERHLIDHDQGSWHHELDRDNRPSTIMWDGKPDLYHALQASLLTELPIGPSLVARLRAAARPKEA